MKILHIFKSEPDDTTRDLAGALSREREAQEVLLAQGEVNYDELVGAVFASDQVVCWW